MIFFDKLTTAEFLMMKKNIDTTVIRESIFYNHLAFCSFGFVDIKLPKLIESYKFEKVVKQFLKELGKKKYFSRMEVKEKIYLFFAILEDKEQLIELENEFLTTPIKPELIRAGVEELNNVGAYNKIDYLTGGDLTKIKKILKVPYHYVFDKQYKDAIMLRVNEKLEISRKKQK